MMMTVVVMSCKGDDEMAQRSSSLFKLALSEFLSPSLSPFSKNNLEGVAMEGSIPVEFS
jgi:hypothetical protein